MTCYISTVAETIFDFVTVSSNVGISKVLVSMTPYYKGMDILTMITNKFSSGLKGVFNSNAGYLTLKQMGATTAVLARSVWSFAISQIAYQLTTGVCYVVFCVVFIAHFFVKQQQQTMHFTVITYVLNHLCFCFALPGLCQEFNVRVM